VWGLPLVGAGADEEAMWVNLAFRARKRHATPALPCPALPCPAPPFDPSPRTIYSPQHAPLTNGLCPCPNLVRSQAYGSAATHLLVGVVEPLNQRAHQVPALRP
jgi:hypothetical protein